MDTSHIRHAHPSDLPEAIGEDEKRKLKKYLNSINDSNSKPNKTSRKVSKQLCSLIEDLAEQGLKPQEICDLIEVKSKNTVYYHLRDECEHKYRDKVTYDECGWMRVYAKKGAPSSTLAILYNVSREIATRHITGKCNHQDGIQPLSGLELRRNSYSGPDMVTKTCPVCGGTFDHKKYNNRTTCSRSCCGKYASMKQHKPKAIGD